MARNLKELEGTIFTSPRAMISHSRTLMENVLDKVMIHENIVKELNGDKSILNKIDVIQRHELLSQDELDALHGIRMLGNQASHDIRQFRFSEALMVWEYLHTVMTWFVEIYVTHKVDVPAYKGPVIKLEQEDSFELEEIIARLEKFEQMLQASIELEKAKEEKDESEISEQEEIAKASLAAIEEEELPGFTTVRTIHYQGVSLHIPHFLRDAFLLPQRFSDNVKRFLLSLNKEEEARIMSELPVKLDGLHQRTVRYNEARVEEFFKELKDFVAEEKRRRHLMQERPGELFLFYENDEIIVTKELGDIEITKEAFPGTPSLIDFLQADGIFHVRDLPKEFVIIGKYQGIGKGRVQRFFEQIREKQG